MSKELIKIKADTMQMEGVLEVPADAVGIVLFAHGSGSSRLSPRNNYVANELHLAKIGTLLLDLLSLEEDQDYQLRFDISLLSTRLAAARDWLRRLPVTRSLPVGLLGASTGAAAALRLAAARGSDITAVVSRGGRPDLAGQDALVAVSAPTLLIVGGLDHGVIELNQRAYAALQCRKQVTIVPGATHLFEEPGTLQEVATLASTWFTLHFPVSAREGPKSVLPSEWL